MKPADIVTDSIATVPPQITVVDDNDDDDVGDGDDVGDDDGSDSDGDGGDGDGGSHRHSNDYIS
ncbi:unnamed protein product, partial [Acanthocheilonema viteae]